MWIVIVGIAICVLTSLWIIVQYNWRSQAMFENWNAVAAEYKVYLHHKIIADSLEQVERQNIDQQYHSRP
jgi:amino acid permease